MQLDLASGVSKTKVVNEHMTLCPVVPLEAAQGWKLELIETKGPVIARHPCIHPQFFVFLEGEIQVKEADRGKTFKSGQHKKMVPRTEYTCITQERSYRASLEIIPLESSKKKKLEEEYFEAKHEADGYSVYELISAADKTWSVALLEINNSPKHYHRIEQEIFIVVEGELALTLDQDRRILSVGESITIVPDVVHQLKSANANPVQVLCFNFPAFNPEDMWIVE